MSGDARGLLDTNAVIFAGRLDPATLPDEPVISTVTLAELSVGPLVATTAEERARRQRQVQLVEASFDAIPFDTAAARAFGAVSASLRAQGRKTSARALDALIAATAIANQLPLYTCNPGDFGGIDELTVRAIPHPDAPPTPDDARLPGPPGGSPAERRRG